jgi:hypothetical protein
MNLFFRNFDLIEEFPHIAWQFAVLSGEVVSELLAELDLENSTRMTRMQRICTDDILTINV